VIAEAAETPRSADVGAIRAAVLSWYRANGRPLAFRRTSDPWAILVSEVMAQQTQASRAAAAWERFVERFPTPGAFAVATPADALRAWRGLGYNRRALALRAAAIEIVERRGGAVPSTVEELDALPGVGPYTARALAALAFGVPAGAVDTNVRRVLSRALFDDPPTSRELQVAADGIVPPDRPGEWTHALMDIGATFCRPGKPRCEACPLRAACRYAAVRGEAPEAARRPVAARGPAAASSRRAAAGFPSTSRWLRGRILEHLTSTTGNRWVSLEGPIGTHDTAAVDAAIAGLAADGLVEIDRSRPNRVRLPTA